MPRALGLMNPANAAKSTGSFKEGYIRIDSCSYKVHKGKPGEGDPPVPATKFAWKVTRLNETGEEPLLNEHDEPIMEELLFSFGGKCLPFVHPGRADSVDDDEVQDLGTDETAQGNTIFLVAADWKPNEKSGLMVLMGSLAKLQVKNEYLDRCWAPDWVGCIFEMKTQTGEKGADGRSFNYKIVSKIITGPGGKKGSKLAGAATPNGRANDDAETVLAPILHALSQEMDNTSLTRKAFLNRIRTALETANVDSKLLVPILALCKDDRWLAAHGSTFDYSLNSQDNTIIFGSVPF